MAALHPPILWAQRKETVLVKVDVPDVKNEKITFDPAGKFSFEGESNGKKYAATLDLFAAINEKESKFVVRPRQVEVLIKKKDAAWWERLLKTAGKNVWLKVDWNQWKDEDEAEDAEFDMGDKFDMGGMPGMPGMGGMGGMDMSKMMAGMGGMGGAGGMDLGAGGDDSDEEDEKKPEEKK